VSCVKPEGAFYAFPDVSGLFPRRWRDQPLGNGSRVCEFLLAEARVALVAGDDFAAPNHIRMSYATSRENLASGFDAIERALATLR
jgi:aspartate aminotransferase